MVKGVILTAQDMGLQVGDEEFGASGWGCRVWGSPPWPRGGDADYSHYPRRT